MGCIVSESYSWRVDVEHLFWSGFCSNKWLPCKHGKQEIWEKKNSYLTHGERMWGQAEARPNKVALSPLSASRSVSLHQVRLVVSRKWAQVGINTGTLPHLLCLLWLELPAHGRQSPALCWFMITDWLQYHLCYDNKNLIHIRLIWHNRC